MGILKTILTVAFTVIILAQEGKSAGLGALAGSSETYWSKNKGRSAEGMKKRITMFLVVLFILLSVVLNLGIF